MSTRITEHKKDVQEKTTKILTRQELKTAQSTLNKSAITDHTTRTNHIIDWEGVKILDREENRRLRQVKEAINIRRTYNTMNRDQGAYTLSGVYEPLFTTGQSSGEPVQ